MWRIAGILGLAVLIMVIEIPSLLKRKKKDLWIFSVLLLFAVVLNILEVRDVPIPNPLKGITAVLHPYKEIISTLFK